MKRVITAATVALSLTVGGGIALAAHPKARGHAATTAGTTTLKLDSAPGFGIRKTPTGKIENPKVKAKPKPGDSDLGIYNDYAGRPANRGPVVGNDEAYCVVVKWPHGNCNDTIYYEDSVVTVALSNIKLNSDPNPVTYGVDYANGVFAHVKHVRVSDIKGYPNDEEFTIPGVTSTTS